MQTTTTYRGIANKNDNKIADKVWWMHSQGARTVPLGQGGQFVHPEGVNPSYGERASWGGLGMWLKDFLYSSFKMYSGHVQWQGDLRADPEPAQWTTYTTEPLGKSLESPLVPRQVVENGKMDKWKYIHIAQVPGHMEIHTNELTQNQMSQW